MDLTLRLLNDMQGVRRYLIELEGLTHEPEHSAALDMRLGHVDAVLDLLREDVETLTYQDPDWELNHRASPPMSPAAAPRIVSDSEEHTTCSSTVTAASSSPTSTPAAAAAAEDDDEVVYVGTRGTKRRLEFSE